MIGVTDVSGSTILIDPDLIKQIESGSETVITFQNHQTVIVRESVEQIQVLVDEYRMACQSFGHNELVDEENHG